MDKTMFAKEMILSRSSLYYKPKQPDKDWSLKIKIEETLSKFPSYGHKRMADHLKINKKRALRVMKLFGIKPYRRRGKKPKKIKDKSKNAEYPNLLLVNDFPVKLSEIWVSDFTYIPFKGKFVYLATIMDIFNREIIGFSVLTNHSNKLVINALLCALHNHIRPKIIHSDQGKEYLSIDYISLLENFDIQISNSRKGCPWENGYQESFYSQFKIDLGDPNRFDGLGELVYEIYRLIYVYNHERIHTALRVSPLEFAKRYAFVHN